MIITATYPRGSWVKTLIIYFHALPVYDLNRDRIQEDL